MKALKTICICLLFMSFSPKIHAQFHKDSMILDQKLAGYQLVLASRHFYTGVYFVSAGFVVTLIGDYAIAASPTRASSSGNTLVLLGSLSALTGFVYMIESYSHIGKAGRILTGLKKLSLSPSHQGLGLAYTF